METKTVLDLATLKHSTNESSGINVHGVIVNVYPAKTFKGHTSQFFTMRDDTGMIGAKISDNPFTQDHIGCDIEINNATWTSYYKDNKQNWYLDALKADVKYQAPKDAVKPTALTKKSPEDFDKKMMADIAKYMEISTALLTDPTIAKGLSLVVDSGFSSEDMRTIAISLFIEANRNRGLIR